MESLGLREPAAQPMRWRGFTQNVSADKHIFKLGINYKTN